MNVLITGATGFVGSSLVNAISEIDGINIKAVVRNKNKSLNFPNNNIKLFCVPCITNFSDWDILLHNIDVVVHTAGKVHHRHKIAKQDIVDFYNINVCATRKLAACSIAAGVKRFIFISSVKVHGDITVKDWPFTEDMPLDPYGYYGLSKYNAEEALKEIAKTTGLEIVIIRPVLVYGNGVKANFKTMLNLLYKNFPLPFAIPLSNLLFMGMS